MSEKTAAIIGATGMTGSYLKDVIVNDNFFEKVRLVIRRPIQKTNPKIEIKLVNFDDAESVKLALEEVNALFCCIGTTQSKVKGDKQLYRKTDLEIPVKLARFGRQAGCEKFMIISSVGANRNSSNFYLRLKGEVEEALISMGIQALHIFQPGMLLGNRQEKRPMEKFMQGFLSAIAGAFIGSLRKYRPIHGKTVAMAMLNASKSTGIGVFYYTYDEIKQLAGEIN
jgi:uncharacterized protein YbjT (DUF2867 family)